MWELITNYVPKNRERILSGYELIKTINKR
jgi:hypothetical protein